MKQLSMLFIIATLLSGCASATIQPTATPSLTITSSMTPSITPTPTTTPSPTTSPSPTVTPTLALPTSIEFSYNNNVPEEVISLVKSTVNQAYWFYVDLGCSPSGFKVNITNYESGEVSGTNGFSVGWTDFPGTNPYNRRIRISHETAHVMCQYGLTNHPKDFRWLEEGVANYFSAMEQYRYMKSGWGSTIADEEFSMAGWVSENYCQLPLTFMESPGVENTFPDFAGVGEVATMLLTKTSSGGTAAITKYYTLKESASTEEAFQNAFDRTKKEFYQQFQDECNSGFPTLTTREAMETFEITYDGEIPEDLRKIVEYTIPSAYAYYIDLGCSSDGFRATITDEKGGIDAVGSFTTSIIDAEERPEVLAAGISSQMAHVMCQLAFTNRNFLGRIDMYWLYEGTAGYFSQLEQYYDSGYGMQNIPSQEARLVNEVANYCSKRQISLSALEPWDNVQEIYPGFWSIIDIASRLLIKTSPDGAKAVMNYYTLLADHPNPDAFQQAFGKSKEEFYQLFQDECKNGFPTIKINPS